MIGQRSLILGASALTFASLSACAPPACAPPAQIGDPLIVRAAPPTYSVVDRPNGTQHVHNFACGAELLTSAEDDVCVWYYDARYNDFVVGPLSNVTQSRGDYFVKGDVH